MILPAILIHGSCRKSDTTGMEIDLIGQFTICVMLCIHIFENAGEQLYIWNKLCIQIIDIKYKLQITNSVSKDIMTY